MWAKRSTLTEGKSASMSWEETNGGDGDGDEGKFVLTFYLYKITEGEV